MAQNLQIKAPPPVFVMTNAWHSQYMRQLLVTLMAVLVAGPALPADTVAPPDPVSTVTLSPPVVVQADEPRYVAPTLRDRIGRIWAPVLINGKGPFRLVLDTGANSSAIIPSVAQRLGIATHASKKVQLHGVTGSAIVPIIMVDSLEIGDLVIDGAQLPVVADVFGGAEG
ncbi:MAG: clan AA aspartic protease, partial [Candidatus Obscuribacterales bacterium]|nr:clan AA aspartic protease [Steroidobacteraceae bacterium]